MAYELVEREYTVQEVFGFNSQLKLKGYEQGHPLVPVPLDNYVFDKVMVRDCISWLQDPQDPVWLSGATGTGKTEFFKTIFGRLGIPTVIISAKSSTEPDDIMGRIQLRDGNTVFVPGELLKAYSEGYAIVFDEIDSYNPEVMMACHRMLERSVISLDDGTHIKPAQRNYMAATANTRGDGIGGDIYVSTKIQNAATLNRFEKWILNYPSQENEIKMVTNYFGSDLDETIVKSMVSVVDDIRIAYNQGSCPLPFSIRDTLRWGRKLISFQKRPDIIPLYHSFDLAFGNGVPHEVKSMLHTIIHSKFDIKSPEME